MACLDIIHENENNEDEAVLQNVESAKCVLKYLRKNIEMTIKRDSNLKYQVKKLSKAVKLCHYLLIANRNAIEHVLLLSLLMLLLLGMVGSTSTSVMIGGVWMVSRCQHASMMQRNTRTGRTERNNMNIRLCPIM